MVSLNKTVVHEDKVIIPDGYLSIIISDRELQNNDAKLLDPRKSY